MGQWIKPGLPTTGGTMEGDIDMTNHSITNVADPSSDNDVANKAYVDTRLQQVETMPTSGIAGDLLEYKGSDETTYKYGHIYKYINDTWTEVYETSGGEYLPLTGGTLSGSVIFNNVGLPIRSGSSSQYMAVCGGNANNDGAVMYLNGKDASGGAGQFMLISQDGTNSTSLVGYPDGTLTWGGSPLATTLQSIYDALHPVGEIIIGFTAPVVPTGVSATWTADTSYNGRALWVDSTQLGTKLTGQLPKPIVSSSFTGYTSNTTSAGSHSHTTYESGYHTHTRGSMEITGTLYNCYGGGYRKGTGAFSDTASAGSSGNGGGSGGDDPRIASFKASNSWSGETASSGAHYHTTDYQGTHYHQFTPSGGVSSSVSTSGVYTGTDSTSATVRPTSICVGVWKRTA